MNVGGSASVAMNLLPASTQEGARQSVSGEIVARAQRAHDEGDALREQQQWEVAIDCYTESIRLVPDFSWSHHSLGDCCKKLGDWRNAVTAYRQAIALKRDFVWSHYSLGDSLEQLAQWEAAADSYRVAIQLDPSNVQVPPRLVGVLRQLLKADPRNIGYYQLLAEQLDVQDKLAEAISSNQLA